VAAAQARRAAARRCGRLAGPGAAAAEAAGAREAERRRERRPGRAGAPSAARSPPWRRGCEARRARAEASSGRAGLSLRSGPARAR
jgi:hypothetical protein